MDFQILAIGPGLGHREHNFLKKLREKRPEISVEKIVACEPNPEIYLSLREKVEEVRTFILSEKKSL